MSNIVEFPPSDRPEHQWTESEVDKLHAEAFRGLEGSISDCVWMSVIALEMVERAIEGRDDKQEKAMFAVFEAAKKLKQLKANYYAAWHEADERDLTFCRKANATNYPPAGVDRQGSGVGNEWPLTQSD